MKVLQCALLLGLALSAAAKSERERLTESAMKAAQYVDFDAPLATLDYFYKF